jgi:ribosome-binding factor A
MSIRQERMADEIRDIVASCFAGGQMQDPRLQQVTITAVKISPDLQIASVYFRTMPGEDIETAKKGLERAAGFFRAKLAQALDVRRVPVLRFFYDESVEHGSRIEDLLTKI